MLGGDLHGTAYFLALIASLADCHSDFLRSFQMQRPQRMLDCALLAAATTVARIVLKASCPKRTLWIVTVE
jgi:hypothetical protein